MTQDGTPPNSSWKNLENHSFNFSRIQERSPENTPLPPQKDLLNSQDENIIRRKIIPIRQSVKINNQERQAGPAHRIIPDRSVQVEEMKATDSYQLKTPPTPHSALLHNLSINLKTPPLTDEMDQEQHGTNADSATHDTSSQQRKPIKISFSFSFSFTFNWRKYIFMITIIQTLPFLSHRTYRSLICFRPISGFIPTLSYRGTPKPSLPPSNLYLSCQCAHWTLTGHLASWPPTL